MDVNQKVGTVLIVDDDDQVRHTLRRLLTRQGIESILEASDGSEAIYVAAKCQPDVVVLDAAMPYMSGGLAAPFIRKQAPEAKIIAFSGQLETKPAWADAFLVKGAETLLEVLMEVMAEPVVS